MGERERVRETHVLKRLDDSVHVYDLRLVRLEWEINIDSSDAVIWHYFRLGFRRKTSPEKTNKTDAPLLIFPPYRASTFLNFRKAHYNPLVGPLSEFTELKLCLVCNAVYQNFVRVTFFPSLVAM